MYEPSVLHSSQIPKATIMMDTYIILAIAIFLFILWCGIFLYLVSQAGNWMHRKGGKK